jgi:hypothetical protein
MIEPGQPDEFDVRMHYLMSHTARLSK